MRILFDHNVPRRLRAHLPGHLIDTARERGWDDASNVTLLDHAENAGYDVMITADQKMKFQQNIAQRNLGVLVLMSNKRTLVVGKSDVIQAALEEMQPGEMREIPIP